MTADSKRRHRRTVSGAIVALVMLIVAVAATIVGVSTLRTSEVGQAVGRDDRVRVAFPSTPVAALAVVDGENRLTSLAMAVLDPAGRGGSIVTIPVNVDTSIGLGETRTPLSSRPFDPTDPTAADALTSALESTIALTIDRAVILTEEALVDLIGPHAPVEVDLPDAVISGETQDEVAEPGVQDLDAEEMAELFTTIDIAGVAYDHHPVDVALWSGLADAVTATPLDAEVPLDDAGRPIEPTSGDELLDRLVSGPVNVRDLAIVRSGIDELANADDSDFVLLDRSDALLVFAEIAPSLVSTPNESLSFQIIAPFTDEQLASMGEDVTTAELVRDLIGELVFAQGNVVSVQTAASSDGAMEETVLQVTEAADIEPVEAVAPVLFGDVDVVEATRVVEGVDVVAVLGTDFLVRRAEIRDEQAATDDTATDATQDGANQDDASDGPGDTTSDTDASESDDESDATSDTVASDE